MTKSTILSDPPPKEVNGLHRIIVQIMTSLIIAILNAMRVDFKQCIVGNNILFIIQNQMLKERCQFGELILARSSNRVDTVN